GTAVAVPNTLVVGDNDLNTTNNNAQDKVIYLDTAGTNQVADGVNLTVNRSGQFNYGTRNETINVVNLDRGSVIGTTGNLGITRATMIGGQIDPGAGTLTLTSNVTFGSNNNAGDSSAHSIE